MSIMTATAVHMAYRGASISKIHSRTVVAARTHQMTSVVQPWWRRLSIIDM